HRAALFGEWMQALRWFETVDSSPARGAIRETPNDPRTCEKKPGIGKTEAGDSGRARTGGIAACAADLCAVSPGDGAIGGSLGALPGVGCSSRPSSSSG